MRFFVSDPVRVNLRPAPLDHRSLVPDRTIKGVSEQDTRGQYFADSPRPARIFGWLQPCKRFAGIQTSWAAMTSITPVPLSLRTSPEINLACGGKPLVSIILPARNEGVGVIEAIGAVDEVLGQLGLPYEIIVGDSASEDGTGERVRALGLSHVSVVRTEVPGKGRVLRRAMGAARGEIIGFLDSDLEIDPDHLRPAIQAVLVGADAAIGSKVNDAPNSRSLARHAITVGANLLIRTTLNTRIADHQAGMKVFRRDVLHAALPHVRATGWLWDTELLARMSARGSSIREIPVRVRPARASGFGSMRQLASAAFELLQVCARLRGNRRHRSLSATGQASSLAPGGGQWTG